MLEQERALAKSLIEEAEHSTPFPQRDLYVEIAEIKITFPSHWVEFYPTETFPPEVLNPYFTAKKLFDPQNIPPHWIEYLKEIDLKRKTAGCDYPIDLLTGVHFVTLEQQKAKDLGIPSLEYSDFEDKERLITTTDTVLANTDLRNCLTNTLVYIMPDQSIDPPDQYPVVKLLKQQAVGQGIFLDLGCGVGKETVLWAQNSGLYTIGLDRQYHDNWYDKAWKEKKDEEDKKKGNLTFIRADFMNGMPVVANCVAIACMEYVVNYISEDGLTKGLQEVKRVLKDKGVFVVGPQETVSRWRAFRKEVVRGEPSLVEVPI